MNFSANFLPVIVLTVFFLISFGQESYAGSWVINFDDELEISMNEPRSWLQKIIFQTYDSGVYHIGTINLGTNEYEEEISSNSYDNKSPSSYLFARTFFVSDRDGNFEIYSRIGSEINRLTFNEEQDSQPIQSPNGKKVAFVRSINDSFEIFTMNSNGSNPHQLTETNLTTNGRPAWSPDGSEIVFHSNRDGNFEIYLMDSNGNNQRKILSLSSDDMWPSWSPDGKKITFARDGNIFSMKKDGSELTQLTSTGKDNHPTWSPDGLKIVFHSSRDGNYEIYLMDADGNNEKNITNDPRLNSMPYFYFSQAIAPSGETRIWVDRSPYFPGDEITIGGGPPTVSTVGRTMEITAVGPNNFELFNFIQPLILGVDFLTTFDLDNSPNAPFGTYEVIGDYSGLEGTTYFEYLPYRNPDCPPGSILENGNCIAESIDFDGDGFSSDQGDCDDNRSTVFPGAQEIPDGLDNDCDGLTDENIPDCPPGSILENGNCIDEPVEIPEWIKETVEWWVGGHTQDQEFIDMIQKLIEYGVIKISDSEFDSSTPSTQIPPWIRDVSRMWTMNQIKDQEFAGAIEFLIKIGVISI